MKVKYIRSLCILILLLIYSLFGKHKYLLLLQDLRMEETNSGLLIKCSVSPLHNTFPIILLLLIHLCVRPGWENDTCMWGFDFEVQCCCDVVFDSMGIISIEIQAQGDHRQFSKMLFLSSSPAKQSEARSVVHADLFVLLINTYRKHTDILCLNKHERF